MAKIGNPRLEIEGGGRHDGSNPTARDEEPSSLGSGISAGGDDPFATMGGSQWSDVPGVADESRSWADGLATDRPAPKLPDYEILAELGRGGMGVVYKACQVWLNRPCALKMILAADFAGPELVLRFLAEAEIVARLHHPHIIQIYRLGSHEGRPYLELEYAAGGSLAARLDGTPWPERQAAALIEPMARAVAEAHRHGIVHRDLKPGNILLTADGTPKVSDFGLAKSLNVDSGLTRTDAVLGTPSYMAPEQAGGRARDVGPAADVYALGAILYELLTGRPPFKAETALETLEMVRTVEPLPPERLRPNVSRDIQTICLRCLQKDPKQRYAGAAELAEDLRLHLAGMPIRARPISAPERAWRWVRRNPRVAGMAASVVLALLVGTAVSTYFAVAATRSADRARDSAIRADDEARRANAATAAAISEAHRADAARDVSGFLVGLFEVDPLAPGGRGFGIQKLTGGVLTAREIVNRGMKALQTQLEDRPAVRATLREIFGSFYVGLGELAQAEPLIAEAVEFRRGNLPAGRLELAVCLHVLGYVRQICYEPSCVDLFRESLAIRRELLGPDNPLTAATMFHLALALLQTEADRDGEARKLLDESLAIWRRLDNKSPQLAYQLLVMGFVKWEGGDAAASADFLEATRILDQVEGGNDVSAFLRIYAAAARIEKLSGEKAAMPRYSQFRDKAEALLGPDHYIVTYANKTVAERLEGCREFDRAEVLYGKAIEGCRRIHSQHKEIGVLMVELGRCIKNRGDTVRAEPILDDAATILERGSRTPHTLIHLNWAYRMRAEILLMRGEQEKGDALLRKADAVELEKKALK